MSYKVTDDKVLWNGRTVKEADASTFEDLGHALGRDRSHVLLRGKPAKVDAASFEVLGPAHARDKAAVYLIMETKLKPLKGADARTFRSLGQSYGRDDAQAYYLDKPIRFKQGTKGSLARFRELHPRFATDNGTLYFTNKPVARAERLAIDWTAARVNPFNDNAVNKPDLAVGDGEACYFSAFNSETWIAVGKIDPADFVPLAADDMQTRGHDFQTDGKRVFFRGAPVEGAAAERALVVSRDVVAAGGDLFLGTRQLPFRDGDLAWLADDLYLTPEGLFQLDARRQVQALLAPACGAHPSPDEAVATAYAALLAATFRLLDDHLPIGTDFSQVDLTDAQPLAGDSYRIARSGGQVELRVGKETIASGPVSGWYGQACRLWARARGRRDALVVFPAPGYLLPDGGDEQRAVIAAAFREMILLSAALWRAGEEEEARLIAHEVLYAHKPRFHDPRNPQQRFGNQHWPSLADLPRELATEARYWERHREFGATTNLACARHVLASGLIDDRDWRVRLEMMRTLNGVMASTSRRARFFEEIIPEVVRRVEPETAAPVRAAMLGVVEMAVVMAFIGAESLKESHYAAIEPVVRFLLAQGVNVDLNRARLVETLWALGKDAEAESEKVALLEDVGDQVPAPALHSHWHAWRTYRLWLLRAKLRLAWLPSSSAGSLAARVKAIRREAADLEARYGGEEACGEWTELKSIAEEIARLEQAL